MPLSDQLLEYYQRELHYLRHAGVDFARRHPKVAARLQLGPEGTPDPHVERLIEAFAFLSARVQRNIDSEFPRLTDALLGALYPQLSAPIPAMAIARFTISDAPASGAVLPRGLALAATTTQEHRCRFRTCYTTTLWPIKLEAPDHIASDRWPFLDGEGVASVVRLPVRALAGSLKELAGASLRLFLGGAAGPALRLADTLIADCDRIAFVSVHGRQTILSAKDVLSQVGFSDDEAVLPETRQGHSAYRLVQEYLNFPEKFRFFDVKLPSLQFLPDFEFDQSVEILFLLRSAARGLLSLSEESFQLGCTPVINLFPLLADPMRLDYRRPEYRIVPDAQMERVIEVHSIVSVVGNSPIGENRIEYAPYFSADHGRESNLPECFWVARRMPAERDDIFGTDTWLSFVDLTLGPTSPPEQTVLVQTLCTNRLLPEQLAVGQPLFPEQPAGGAHCELISSPTTPRLAPRPGSTPWRLVSQLTLNHLSLTDGPDALNSLQEILRLYGP
ncbi:MAG: type VI secretion system baseplate subunit TssF, partial [Roseomonas sp.]|nr:type VI secretion system baseplate subunit TssF [Roseomonas sp.]